MNKKIKNRDGLPKIAEMAKERTFIISVIMIIGVLIAIFSVWLHGRGAEHLSQPDEETYSVSQEKKIEVRPVQSSATPLVEQQVIQKEAELVYSSTLQEKAKVLQLRLSSPLMLVNSVVENQAAPIEKKQANDESNPNTRFLQKISSHTVKPVEATVMGDLSMVIGQGNLIHAILEPATNSDLPGALRAIVSEPVYSEDGSQVLIPRGSRLIGEYKSGMQQGQSRIFIVWSRLITPLGLSLQLGSTGVDSLGVAGVGADSINKHFWQRFGTASLLSVIGIGTGGSGSDLENSISAYRSAVANSFSQSASQSLQQDNNIAPTLKTMQGKPIMVFVAKDLQFANAMQSIKTSVYVF